MNNIMKKTLSAALAFIFILMILLPMTGCEETPIVVCTLRGEHDNFVGAPINTSKIIENIDDVFSKGGQVIDIIVDGESYIVADYKPEKITGWYTKSTRADMIEDDRRGYVNACSKFKAVTPESDLFAGIDMAARALRSAAPGERRLIIVDSGLSTAGVINFTKTKFIDLEPEEIVAMLTEMNALPDLTGVKVIWVGQAQVSGEQPKLTYSYRAKLHAIWDAILVASNAEEIIYADDILPNRNKQASELPECSIVPMPEDEFPIPDKTPLKLEEIRFKPRSAEIADREKALDVLAPLAEDIKNRNIDVTLLGTCASVGDIDSSIELSMQRSEAVREILLDLGVTTNITCLGIGQIDFSYKVQDLDDDGNLIESKAESNRAVYIYENGSPIDKEIKEIVAAYEL